ncbi:lantibiotic dehydratase [Streptomyces sp. NPDC056061]|uniref:lantibiotic dehydratase n=1 Tax=Streptomyces sp. NPDC056061 TaxID=3345700 RepID=UPI0035D77E0D
MVDIRVNSRTDSRGGVAGARLLGGTALVRASGVPFPTWTAAGGSGLFGRVVEHADTVERHSVTARLLAERLGRVVPDPRLTASERRAVLALRRRLHSGAAPGPSDYGFLVGLAAVPAQLGREIAALCLAAESARATRGELERALDGEWARVGELAWTLVSASPVLREFLEAATPGLAAEVTARLAAGESWSGKRLRKRSAYLWRAVGRAAAKTTPRGWVGQVAPVPIGRRGPGDGAGGPLVRGGGAGRGGSGGGLLSRGAVLEALAADAMENVHELRTGSWAVDLRTADPATLLAPAPLYLTEGGGAGGGSGGTLCCYVLDPGDPGRLRKVTVRRTGVLRVLLTSFAEGPCTIAELEGALPTAAPGVLRAFLAHLMGLGVLQLCLAPRHEASAWTPAGRAAGTGLLPHPVRRARTGAAPGRGTAAGTRAAMRTGTGTATGSGTAAGGTVRSGTGRGDREPDSWFLDSYRRLDAHVSDAAAARVQRALRTAHRLAELRRVDREATPGTSSASGTSSAPGIEELDERPRPVGELLATLLSPDAPLPPVPEPYRYLGWHPARVPRSGYARLLAHLASCRDRVQVDVDDVLLDALGAPSAEDVVPPWPLDCLLRPLSGSGPVAVLETASPAGIIDARFTEALRNLYGGYDTADAYREFLAAVERRSGVRFVELLVPPVTEHAANTIRRPALTRWWTGDPNPSGYFGIGDPGDPGGPGGPGGVSGAAGFGVSCGLGDTGAFGGSGGSGPRYLPLDRITLRRSGGRTVAEVDGERVLPVYHATRNPMPPYDRLVRLLLSAGHPWAGNVLRLDGLAAAFPACDDVTRTPRLIVGTHLVVAPATWRVPRTRLWRRDDTDLDRVRVLASLRRSAGMPRFVFVRPAFEAKPVPVDLEALTALNVVERTCAALPGDELVFEEMLPGPAVGPRGPVLRDALHRGEPVAAGLVLRTPFDSTADELAVSTAAALTHDVPGPSAPGAGAAGAVHTQQETPRRQEEASCPSWSSRTSTP